MGSEEGQHSLWVPYLEHRLRIVKENLQIESDGFQILKVPIYHCQPPSAFTPIAWPFGLHNREDVARVGSEDVKLAVATLFGLDERSAWISFCNDVVYDPRRMLACYGLREEVTDLRKDEIKWVLAFDALFLALFIDICTSSVSWASGGRRLWTGELVTAPTEANLWKILSTFGPRIGLLDHDLCKMENQIPFDLIKKAIKHIKKLTNPHYQDEAGHPNLSATQDPDPYLEKWMKKAVWFGVDQFKDIYDDIYEKEKEEVWLSESHHILDAAHKAICGANGMQRKSDFTQTDYIHVPSARRLKNSGIQIEGVGGPLCTMSYNKDTKCLSLPKMRIFDETVAFVRNMARYEQYFRNTNCMFHDYVSVMLDLVETKEDLKILIDHGVIHNGCGRTGFEKWKSVGLALGLIYSSKEHNQMKRDIISRCRLRHRLWSEFRTPFFSRPCYMVSALAVTLMTLATLIQTYAAVIGSHGMKP